MPSETPRFNYKSEHGDNLCNKHYIQLVRKGKILENTRLDEQQIEIKNNHAEIILIDTYANEVGRALIDIEDINKVKKYKWYLDAHGYVMHKGCNLRLKLHEYIFGKKKGYIIDHINRTKSDCRKLNLRFVTHSQNNMNRDIQSNNTSGVTGVYFRKDRNKWMTNIQVNNSVIFLGNFDNYDDAVKARQNAEEKYFGEYRRKE